LIFLARNLTENLDENVIQKTKSGGEGCPMQSTIAIAVLLVAMCLAVVAQHGTVAHDESARVLSLEKRLESSRSQA
jgi:hypothetical protein